MVYLREFGPKEKIHNVERNPTGKMWIQSYPPNLYFMPEINVKVNWPHIRKERSREKTFFLENPGI